MSLWRGIGLGLIVAFASLVSGVGSAEEACPAEPFTDGEPNDPLYGSSGSWGLDLRDQWGLVDVDAYPIAAVPPPSRPIVVAVIDTGIDFEHPDLASENLWRNHAEEINDRDDDDNGYVDDVVGWNFVDADNVPWDYSGHGTHVAGVIAAQTNNGRGIAGVNPLAVLMPLKVASFVGYAEGGALAAAIDYAVDMKADIINLSMGGPFLSEAEQAALVRAQEADVLVVTAAGNTAADVAGFGYAGVPGVLTVAATGPDRQRATFSNFGARVDVAAPGVEILSLRAADSDFIRWTEPVGYMPAAAVVGSGGRYYRATGTSFAAALVTGVASRVLYERNELTDTELVRVLTQSATDIDVPGVDQATGYGLVNLKAALRQPADEFIDARLTQAKVVYRDEHIILQIFGQADAERFDAAELTYARDSAPDDWQPFPAPIGAAVADGLLTEVDLETLMEAGEGPPTWQLKLVVREQGGASREARLRFGLPVPEQPAAEGEGDA